MEARRFEETATGDTTLLNDWLSHLGYEVKEYWKLSKIRHYFEVNGERKSPEEFYEVVDAERRKRGLEPIRRRQ